MSNFISKIKSFKPAKILVIGDIILDKYVYGSVDRVSQEAPIPILKVENESYVLGGAANTASNISSMHSAPFIFGVLGYESNSAYLKSMFLEKSIDDSGTIFSSRKTTLKTRYVSRGQQLLRVDSEDTSPIPPAETSRLIQAVERQIRDCDSVIISDYAKGVVTEKLSQDLVGLCRAYKKPLIIDPRPQHTLFYKGATIITPNTKEAEDMSKIGYNTEEDIEKIGSHLQQTLGCSVMLTRAEKGISVFHGNEIKHISTFPREVADVSGAGDTVVAALAVSLSNGLDIYDAAVFANHAGGVKVQKSGTATVSLDEVIHDIELHNSKQ